MGITFDKGFSCRKEKTTYQFEKRSSSQTGYLGGGERTNTKAGEGHRRP